MASCSTEPVVLRQAWGFRWQPRVVCLGTFVFFGRAAASFHNVVEGAAAIIAGALIATILYLLTRPRASQRLIIDSDGLTWRFGRTVQTCTWAEIVAIKRTGQTKSGRDGYGILVECGNDKRINLNGCWSTPRKQIIPMLVERCREATGRAPPIIGAEVEIRNAGRILLLAGAVIVLPIVGFIVLATMLARHHHQPEISYPPPSFTPSPPSSQSPA